MTEHDESQSLPAKKVSLREKVADTPPTGAANTIRGKDMRPSGRRRDELRPVSLDLNWSKHAEGACLARFGDTHVLCNATVEERVPPWMRNSGRGWVTAEYGMLPRSTNTRMDREASRGKQSGRSLEIQRLIGRSLREAIDLTQWGEHTIKVDCDVIQADGGTRTASITGAYVALCDAINPLLEKGILKDSPIKDSVAAISLGIKDGEVLIDLDYAEDSNCDTDMNVVMTGEGKFVEIQGTAEGEPFSKEEMDNIILLAEQGITRIIQLQRNALK